LAARAPIGTVQESLRRNATVRFFEGAIDELRKVHWPSTRETTNLVGLVIAASLVVGIFLGGLDYVFAQVMQRLIGAS
jgi:preprotein translocase subunit SecE